jgi:hypothetical protein
MDYFDLIEHRLTFSGIPMAAVWLLISRWYISRQRGALLPVSGGASGTEWPAHFNDEFNKAFADARANAEKYGAKAGNQTMLGIPILKTTMENREVASRVTQIMMNWAAMVEIAR